MTAEIAILNKYGLAIAADSKVTISTSNGHKTFDTVNKVFTLSKIHPICIMVFGNAEFMRYPWETIVKQYRANKRGRSEKTVALWAEDFLKHLRAFGNIQEKDIGINIYTILSSHFQTIQEQALAEARRQKIAAASTKFVELLTRLLDRRVTELSKRDNIVTEIKQKEFIQPFGGVVTQAVDDNFKTFDDPGLIEKAREFSLLALFKNDFSPQSSGVVIAGFGDDEYFPALIHLDADGYVGLADIKIVQKQQQEITRDNACAIIPFAQKEMVHRFMDGIDPDLLNVLPGVFYDALLKNCLEVLEQHGDAAKKTDQIKDAIRQAARDSIDGLGKRFQNMIRRGFSQPIVGMVAALPKDELAHLAESLVALTSLKRHVSHDVETVGGPIDVALISKGDGFVWIKRKHYFKPELNPHFSPNYMRGVFDGDSDERSSRPKGRKRTAKAKGAGG
jgi:hypothetical protein